MCTQTNFKKKFAFSPIISNGSFNNPLTVSLSFQVALHVSNFYIDCKKKNIPTCLSLIDIYHISCAVLPNFHNKLAQLFGPKQWSRGKDVWDLIFPPNSPNMN